MLHEDHPLRMRITLEFMKESLCASSILSIMFEGGRAAVAFGWYLSY